MDLSNGQSATTATARDRTHGAPAGSPAHDTLASEAEIGSTILQARRYAEETIHRADEQAKAMLRAAEGEAARIVASARREANTDDRQGQVASDVVADLVSSVTEFTQTNAILIRHLDALCRALGQQLPTART